MIQKNRILGINAASLLPWSLGPWGATLSLYIARAAGYDGLQILPLKGWGINCSIPQKNVISYEYAWNTGTTLGAFQR